MESTTPQHHKPLESPISEQTLEIPISNSDDQLVEEEEEEDRISNLPESVIGLILSKLPTKCAIATAVLSTRWRYLFSSIPNPIIKIDDSGTASPSFINFVPHLFNNILPQFSVIQYLSLRLYGDYSNQHVIEEWLSTAPTCNLHHLRLMSFKYSLGISSFDVLRPFASSLRGLDLVLSHQWHLVAPQLSMSFPNLTSIYIYGAHFVGLNSFERALAACPNLKSLGLSGCRYPAEQDVVSISVPSLRTLRIARCYHHNLELLLDTPDLELLVYNDYIGPGYPVLNSAGFPSLSEAIFDNVEPYARQWDSEGRLVYTRNVANLLAACYNVKTLCFNVSGLGLEATFSVPTFRNLTTLNYGVTDIVGWELLPKFLHNSPILQVLKFSKAFSSLFECCGRLQSRLPESVPTCLSSHLSEIVFEVFRLKKEVVELVQYLLRTAQVLEKMSIYFSDNSLSHEELMKIQKDIRTSPICSSNCQIDIVRLNEY